MRSRPFQMFWCAAAIALIHSHRACADTPFPYVAYVAAADARVMSGPGEKHYPVQSLPTGYAVEVYRHDDGGWCAVRPPDGSFSLVDSSELRLVEPGVGEVLRSDAPSRVGSSHAGKQNAVQVLLGAGELVEVLEPPPEGQRWVKIAPPAGEFRWIAAEGLSATPPVEVVAQPTISNSDSRWEAYSPQRPGDDSAASKSRVHRGLEFRPRAAADEVESPRSSPANVVTQPNDSDTTGLVDAMASTESHQPSANPFGHLSPKGDVVSDWSAQREDESSPDEIELVDGSPAAIKLAQYESRYDNPPEQRPAWPAAASESPPAAEPSPTTPAESPSPVQNAQNASAPPALSSNPPSNPSTNAATPATVAPPGPPRMRFPGAASRQEADQRLFELQLRLSQLIVQPPANWQLGQLRSDASALLADVEQPDHKRQLQEMLHRIATFEQAQVRYTRPWTLGAPAASSQLASMSGSTTSQPATALPGANSGTSLAMSGGQADEIRQRVQSDLAGGQPAANRTFHGVASESVASHDITPTPSDPFVGAMPGDTTARYDAVGTLKTVVSKRQQAPRYALVDDDGGVIAFLTPPPEVNLQRFVGQRIGVNGSRGFMPEFRRAHVTASRVTPLEGGLVR